MIAEDVDRIGRPKVDAVSEEFDVSEVKAEIAQIHGRLNLQFGSIEKEKPAKRTDSENGEEAGQNPDRKVAIFRCVRFFAS